MEDYYANCNCGNAALGGAQQLCGISVVYFVTQLVVDVLCAYLADRTGCRKCAVSLELCSAVGLIGLAFLPELLPAPLC